MGFLLLCFVAGALTVLGPCTLPVLPFVFARPGQSFARSTLPMLAGLALGFAGVAALASVGGAWVADLSGAGRGLALALFAVTGLGLLMPVRSAALLSRFGGWGAAWSDRIAPAGTGARGVGPSLLLGVATGLLWVPCAGPVLGLVLTAAAVGGPDAGAVVRLLAYAAGAATALGMALGLARWAGRGAARHLQRWSGFGESLRRLLGAAVLLCVAAIATGLDGRLLALLPAAGTDVLEQRLLDALGPQPSAPATVAVPGRARPVVQPVVEPAHALPVEAAMPELDGLTGWLQGGPLTRDSLRGKVVLIDFWTFDCINCRRALPYVRAWDRRYRDQGLVVIGVHAPEFAHERKAENVQRALRELGIEFPVAQDNDFALWKAFGNRYWPAHYFIDAQGRIRWHHFGEGAYEESERVIRQLLDEARRTPAPARGT